MGKFVIEVSDKFEEDINKYLERFGYAGKNELVRQCLREKIYPATDYPKTGELGDDLPMEPKGMGPIQVPPPETVVNTQGTPWNGPKAKVAPKKSATRSDLCPHMISKLGYCKECSK